MYMILYDCTFISLEHRSRTSSFRSMSSLALKSGGPLAPKNERARRREDADLQPPCHAPRESHGRVSVPIRHVLPKRNQHV